MYSLFDSLFNSTTYYPRFSRLNENKLEVDLPGIGKDNISVKVDENLLTVTATKDKNIFYEEQFRVSNRVDTRKVKAKYTDGVLSVDLPVKEGKESSMILIE